MILNHFLAPYAARGQHCANSALRRQENSLLEKKTMTLIYDSIHVILRRAGVLHHFASAALEARATKKEAKQPLYRLS
jgi:hypothetical protein